VDNTAAVSTGREIYGFPKEQGVLRFPGDAGAGGKFSVDTLVIKRFGADSRAEVGRLVTVESLSERAAVAGADPWSSVGEGFEELGARIAGGLLSGVDRAMAKGAAVSRRLVASYLNREMHLVFLKQFRDVRDPSRACYQAVIEAPMVVDAWRGGGFLPVHQVTIEKADSHPIVEELGLSGGVVKSVAGMWLTYDFTVDRGSVIRSRS
jgi:hypothetical protein